MTKKVLFVFKMAGLVLLAVSFFLIVSNSRLLADDLLYFTFFRHGLKEFILIMKEHYLTINARLFVHAFLCFLLSFDSFIPIMVAEFLIFLVTLFFATKLLQKDSAPFQWWLFFLLGFLIFVMGDFVVIDGVLWFSGFFNYIFPLMFLCMYLFFLRFYDQKNFAILAIVFALFTSLTTELMGVLVILFTLTDLIIQIVKKKNIQVIVICLIVAIVGLSLLFSSPGIKNRLLHDSDIGLIQRSLILLTILSQMSFEKASICFVFFVCSLVCAITSKKVLSSNPLAFLFGFFSVLYLLGSWGVVFPAWLDIGFYVIESILLLWYSISFLMKKEYALLFGVFGFGASFAIICASGVVAYRGLFTPAIFLIVIAARSLLLLELSNTKVIILVSLMGMISFCNSVHLFIKAYPNAKTWDENLKIIQSHQGDGPIEINNSPDECYYRASFEYYYYYYLPEFGVSNQLVVNAHDKTYYTVVDEKNEIISDISIKRGDHYYIHSRALADYLGAEIKWRYETASIIYQGKQYSFKSLTNAVMTKDIGGHSFKSKAPIIIVNQKLFISLEDANSIFGTNLKVVN